MYTAMYGMRLTVDESHGAHDHGHDAKDLGIQ